MTQYEFKEVTVLEVGDLAPYGLDGWSIAHLAPYMVIARGDDGISRSVPMLAAILQRPIVDLTAFGGTGIQ